MLSVHINWLYDALTIRLNHFYAVGKYNHFYGKYNHFKPYLTVSHLAALVAFVRKFWPLCLASVCAVVPLFVRVDLLETVASKIN